MFILSNAGKPVWSRVRQVTSLSLLSLSSLSHTHLWPTQYGDEQNQSTLTGVLATFVTIVEAQGDEIQAFFAGRHSFVYVIRGPLYLVMVARTEESVAFMAKQLYYLYQQIVSLLTSGFVKIFERRATFDLRNLLGGTEKLLDDLVHFMDNELAFSVGAVQCLRLEKKWRRSVGQALLLSQSPDLIYAMLISKFSLVNMVRFKEHVLKPQDIDLLLNFVNSSAGFREDENWTPICLPRFNDRGFLHSYVCFVRPDVCLLLIGTKPDAFHAFREKKAVILAHIEASGALDAVEASVARGPYAVADCGITPGLGLRHFMYKARRTAQFTAPTLGEPYASDAGEKQRFLARYRDVRHRLLNGGRHHRMYFASSKNETILAFMTGGFELYCVFGPAVKRSNAMRACNEVMMHIKAVESELFISEVEIFK